MARPIPVAEIVNEKSVKQISPLDFNDEVIFDEDLDDFFQDLIESNTADYQDIFDKCK